jgi:hypothetical protein
VTATPKPTREEILQLYQALLDAMLAGNGEELKVAQRFRRKFWPPKATMGPVLSGLRDLARAHRSLSTPELREELGRRVGESVAAGVQGERPPHPEKAGQSA